MDLAEIRKKSRRSKAETATAAPAEPRGGQQEAEAVAPSAESAAAEPAAVRVPSEPVPQRRRASRRNEPAVRFDPAAAILAGRASMAETEETASADVETAAGDLREFICFRIFREEYALNIMEIKEIIKPRQVTEVPRTPPFVAGVLSLRGTIIPILDVGKRLGFTKQVCSGKERIIVVRHGEGFCGLLVDEVSQVVRLQESAFEPPPLVLDGVDRDFVSGLGRHEAKMLILLNLEKVLDFRLQ